MPETEDAFLKSMALLKKRLLPSNSAGTTITTIDYKSQVESLRQVNDSLRQQLADTDKNWQREKTMKESLEKGLQDLSAYRKELQQQLEELARARAAAEQATKDSKALLQSVTDEHQKAVNELQEQLAHAQSLQKQALAERDTFEARLATAEQHVSELLEAQDQDEQRMQTLTDRVASLKKSLQESRDESIAFQKLLEALKAQMLLKQQQTSGEATEAKTTTPSTSTASDDKATIEGLQKKLSMKEEILEMKQSYMDKLLQKIKLLEDAQQRLEPAASSSDEPAAKKPRSEEDSNNTQETA